MAGFARNALAVSGVATGPDPVARAEPPEQEAEVVEVLGSRRCNLGSSHAVALAANARRAEPENLMFDVRTRCESFFKENRKQCGYLLKFGKNVLFVNECVMRTRTFSEM